MKLTLYEFNPNNALSYSLSISGLCVCAFVLTITLFWLKPHHFSQATVVEGRVISIGPGRPCPLPRPIS